MVPGLDDGYGFQRLLRTPPLQDLLLSQRSDVVPAIGGPEEHLPPSETAGVFHHRLNDLDKDENLQNIVRLAVLLTTDHFSGYEMRLEQRLAHIKELSVQLSLSEEQVNEVSSSLLSGTIDIAHYLGSQLDLFDGNLFFALAAYNSGPGNADRWRQRLPAADMDLLVELMDITETRIFVKVVLENYAMYRFLYGGAAQPSLLTSPGP